MVGADGKVGSRPWAEKPYESRRNRENKRDTDCEFCVTLVYIMAWIILLVLSLGFWSLLLMEQAFQRQEFSRMVGGTLVAVAAGGVLGVYFLMRDCIQYLSQDINMQPSSVSMVDSIADLNEFLDPSLWIQ